MKKVLVWLWFYIFKVSFFLENQDTLRVNGDPRNIITCWFYLCVLIVFQILPEAATGGVLQKKVFLKIPQNSQENTCVFL